MVAPFTEIENVGMEKKERERCVEFSLELRFGHEFEMSMRHPVKV